MTALTPFTFEGRDFRALLGDDGESLFVAGDIASYLGYSATAAMTRSLDDDEKGVRILHTLGGEQQVTVITEAGLYSAILRSRVEGAQRFKRWVTHDVLPAIRRHGLYATAPTLDAMLADPDTAIRLLTELKTEREQRQALAAQVEADKPKVLFADAVAVSSSDILVRDLAKVLQQNGVDVGGTRLFQWLRRDGFLIKAVGTDTNHPTQRAMQMGLFRIKETAVTHSDGRVTTNITPKVTGKGQRYFVERYLREQVA